MSINSIPDGSNQAAQFMAMEIIAELLATTTSGQLAQKLTEQLREFSGANTILLINHIEKFGKHEILHACPTRRASIFTPLELGYFCPDFCPGALPYTVDDFPANHPLRDLLLKVNIKTILRFPLYASDELVGTLLFLDLPELKRINQVEEIINFMMPLIAIALRNSLSHQQIEKQAQKLELLSIDLENRVVERTKELEKANKALSTSRVAALNIMEDAIEAKQHAEKFAIDLQAEITERKRIESSLRESENRFRSILQDIESVAVQGYAPDGTTQYWNKASETLYGYSAEEAIGENLINLVVPPEMQDDVKQAMKYMAESGNPIPASELSLMRKDGSRVPVFSSHTIVKIPGKPQELFCIDINLSELKRAEESYQTLFNEMLDGFALHEIITDENGKPVGYKFLAVNPAFEISTGLKASDIIGRNVLDIMPETESYWIETYGNVALTGEPIYFENYSADLHKYFEVTAFRPAPNQFACIFSDITERKVNEEERLKLEAQLQQSLKMESVGRLAGGVAHDFNNMLGVILGHAEMALDGYDLPESLQNHLSEIRKAAERSADLTRQLLAFARKQTVAPKVLDLNETISGMLKMLKRLIGEDIDLNWHPLTDLWPVKMDPSQIDQILANLCVNARAAITGVGKITIKTEHKIIDDECGTSSDGFIPGEYICLTVSDDGCGMDKETIEHIFEPFYTTKGIGEGTGLGLATVYGAIKQNNGFIIVDSEPGTGTTFYIYIPRHIGKSEQLDRPNKSEPVIRGQETVLLVEDEPSILKLATSMLERLGYKVIPASTPGEAMRQAEIYAGEIQILMTDVVMPEMNGRDLAKNLLQLYPKLKRLFMSGYTSDVIAHHGVLDEGVYFIQKPFTMKTLSAKIRGALDDESEG